MIRFLLRRIVISIITLFLLSIIVFSMIHLIPGDPVRMMLPMESTEEDAAEMRKILGLEKPMITQYFLWLGKAIRLDFGKSIRARYSATEIFFDKLPATLELTFSAIAISVCFAIPVGIFAAMKKGTYLDFCCSFVSLFGLCTPRFWIGILLILVFSLHLGWFPPFGRGPGLFYGIGQLFKGQFIPFYQAVKSLTLPSISVATWSSAIFLRYTRASVLEELGKLYVKTARQKGITEFRVMFYHVIRNALTPIVTVIGLQMGVLLGGAVVIEIVYSWPGVGRLLIDALYCRDYPLIQASIFMIGTLILIIFIILDVIYIIIDPRIIAKNYQ
jgi:ABC-type dipeptide/oligopeptide/nickel transport system permease component